MLKFMRKKTKSIFIYAIFTVLILVFVLWGVGGIKTDRSNIAATINGEIIQNSDFLKVYQNQIDFYRNLYKDDFSGELLESLNLKERVLDGMIDNTLFLQEARRLNLKVSTEELFDNIKTTQAFQRDGAFDKDLYLGLLKGKRILPGEYEQSVEDEILVKKLGDLILQHIKVSDSEVKDFFDYEERRINLQYIPVNNIDFNALASLTESETREYFKKNPQLFKLPDKFRFNYLLFKPEDLKGEMDTNDVKTEDPKKVSMEKAKKNAWDIADRAFKEGLPLKEIAKKDGLKMEETGFLAREGILRIFRGEPKVAEEALSLSVGKVSRPIDGIQGVYIFELVDMKVEHVPPYEEVSQQVRISLTQEKVGEKARETSEELLKRLKEGEDFSNLTKDKGLEVLETGLFSKRNRVIPGLGMTIREGVSTFSLTPKAPFTILNKGNQYYIVKLRDVQAPSDEEYQQAKAAFKKEFLGLKRRETLFHWTNSLKDKSEIEINRDVI